jgi:hypothetical protein
MLAGALAGALAVPGIAALSRAAFADEYCVSCTGPAAEYRCEIEGTSEGSGKDPRSQLLCITTLANTGGHESCSVNRNPAGPCPGILKVVAAAAGEQPPLPPGLDPNANATTEVPKTPPGPAAGPPQTVEQMAGETVKSSKEGLQNAGKAISGTAEKTGETIGNAGSAVGNAAKKTWECLKSLFSDC